MTHIRSKTFATLFLYRIYIILSISILPAFNFVAFSQSQKIDSLKSLSESLTGTKKADVLNKLALELASYDNEAFTKTANEALNLSEQLHYQKGKAEALIYLALSYYTNQKSDTSIQILKESIKLSKKIGDNGLLGYGLTQLGRTHMNLDHADSGLYYLKESYAVLKDSLNPQYLARVYYMLADYYGIENQQENQLKYLKKCLAIRRALNDQSLVWVSVRIASYYIDHYAYKEAMQYLDDAQNILGKDTINNEYISAIREQYATIYFKQGNYPRSLALFYAVRKFYEQNSYHQDQAKLLLNIGLVFDNQGNYEAALKHYFEGIAITTANKYEYEQTKLEYSIAWAYFRLRQYTTAESYVKKAMASAETHHHQAELATTFNLMGLIADEQNNNADAFNYFNKALKIRAEHGDSLRVAATLFNIALLHEKLGDLKPSLDFQLRSLSLQEAGNNLQGMAYSYQGCGQLYTKLRSFQKAEYYLNKAEQISKKIKANYILVKVYEAKRALYSVQSKFDTAMQYTKLYDNLKDSIFNEGLSSRISILENIYQLQEKESQIQLLNQEKKIQEDSLIIKNAQIRQQQFVIFTIILSLLLVSVVAFIIFRYYKKVKSLNHEITEQNEEIQAQTEELTEYNDSLSKLNREIFEKNEEILAQAEELTESNNSISCINETLEQRIEMRTSELKQAYKELDTFFYRSSHDFRRPLTTFMGLAEVAKLTVKDNAALELFEKVNETARSLDKMLFKLQSISDVGSHELIYKEVFIRDVFEMELNRFKGELDKKQIHTTISVNVQESFCSYPALIMIIVQNLIENAIDFSTNISPIINLSALEKGGEVIIEVHDNGQGISPEYMERVFDMYFRANDRSKGNGLGLYIVKKTVQKLNGRIEISSFLRKGTTVRVFLPNHQA